MDHKVLQSNIDKANQAIINGSFDEAELLAGDVIAALDEQILSFDYPNRSLLDLSPSPPHSLNNDLEKVILRANALLSLADISRRRGKYDTALVYATQVFDIAENYSLDDVLPKAHNLLGIVYKNLGSYDKALEFYTKALAAHEKFGDKLLIARVTGNIGITYTDLGNYDRALDCYSKALAIFQELDVKSGVALVLGNIGNVNHSLGNYDNALEYFTKALRLHEELGAKSEVALVMGNIGVVYDNLGTYDKALEYYSKVLLTHEELGEIAAIARITGNIGLVYKNLRNYTNALEYFTIALEAHEALGALTGVSVVTGYIGSLYSTFDFEGYNADRGEEYLLKAIAMSETIGAKHHLYQNEKAIAELYKSINRKADAFDHLERYIVIKEEVQSEEAKMQAVRIEQRKQADERDKEIEITTARAAAKLSATTNLLHQVLPESIATRMIAGERDIADYFPTVSILFADIAGFTPISADMPAYMVVRFLNYVFGIFDSIMKKHGCEKIKTIGDGYLAVAGAPVSCDDHAERMAYAAIEMQQADLLPDEFIEFIPADSKITIRIGLHLGSIVGGVIGEERFVYDIYSDAVNTASRMESHGVADKIHVSHDYVLHLQNRFAMTKNTTHGISFDKRGEMLIKGKGMMKTYFLKKA